MKTQNPWCPPKLNRKLTRLRNPFLKTSESAVKSTSTVMPIYSFPKHRRDSTIDGHTPPNALFQFHQFLIREIWAVMEVLCQMAECSQAPLNRVLLPVTFFHVPSPARHSCPLPDHTSGGQLCKMNCPSRYKSNCSTQFQHVSETGSIYTYPKGQDSTINERLDLQTCF